MCYSHDGTISASITHWNALDFQYDDMWHLINQFFILDSLCIYWRPRFSQLFMLAWKASVCLYEADRVCVHAHKSVFLCVLESVCEYELSLSKNINKCNMYVWPKKAVRLDLCPCLLCASLHVVAYFKLMHFSFAGKTSLEQFRTKITVYSLNYILKSHFTWDAALHNITVVLLCCQSPHTLFSSTQSTQWHLYYMRILRGTSNTAKHAYSFSQKHIQQHS